MDKVKLIKEVVDRIESGDEYFVEELESFLNDFNDRIYEKTRELERIKKELDEMRRTIRLRETGISKKSKREPSDLDKAYTHFMEKFNRIEY